MRYKKLHEKALIFAAELGVAEEFKGSRNWINKVVSKWKDQKSGNSEGWCSYGSDSNEVAQSTAGEAEAGNEFGAEEYEGLSLQLHQDGFNTET